MYMNGVFEEFNLAYVLIAIIPFLFYRFMQKRERAWLICLSAIYLCLSFFLLILLNPSPDRQSRDLNKVFFTASHVMIAMLIGYGLTLTIAVLATQYERVRQWVLMGLGAGVAIAVYGVVSAYVGTANPLVHFNAIYGLALAVAAFALMYLSRKERLHSLITGLCVVFALMPVYTAVSHWEDNEQRGHLFGYWFGHDMFTPPFGIYPEMDRHTVLYGGTDPGRFNPTYMIYCESFIPPGKKPRDPKFDRRDVYLITQNALADGTYLNYIRAHYNRSAQIDPPFFQELLRGPRELELNLFTNVIARTASVLDGIFLKIGDNIEKGRRAGSSFFRESDFLDLPGFAGKLRQPQDAVSQFVAAHLSDHTKQLLAQSGAERKLRRALATDLNALLERELEPKSKSQINDLEARRSQAEQALGIHRVSLREATEKNDEARQKRAQQEIATLEPQLPELAKQLGALTLYEPERFKGVALSEHVSRFVTQNPKSHTRIRLNRLLLEAAYSKELAQSPGGVYPDREILSASNEDSQRCFQEYLTDAQRRLQAKQLKPGEDVRIIDNKVQVSGQIAVMTINGLISKVMFDKNPDHEFYVEESFPLDWMYPHLTPFGIIMKINRNPVPEFTEEILKKDHDFWSQYSERLIGNWITYDTPVSNICAFAEKVYFRRDYRGFQGDPKFIRDSDGQKAFSKLRSSIAGIYSWRISNTRNPAEQQRVIKEADFAFKQAFAFCPYSPEAVFRYAQLLATLGRIEDARLIAVTAQKLDPYNTQLEILINQLRQAAGSVPPPAAAAPPPPTPPSPAAASAQLQTEAQNLEKELAAQPAHLPAAARLLSLYADLNQTTKLLVLADQVIANPQADANALLAAADASRRVGQYGRVEQALAKLVKLVPESPEAWFDLAGFQAVQNKTAPALESLRKALELSARRRAQDTNAGDLRAAASEDTRFAALKTTPEFQKLLTETQAPK
jgi:hypothetical protein